MNWVTNLQSFSNTINCFWCYVNSARYTAKKVLLTVIRNLLLIMVACALVTQRARVRSPVGTNFLGEVFSGFSSSVRQMSGNFRLQGTRKSFGHHYHPYSFITGTNDLRCRRALKPQIYNPLQIMKAHEARGCKGPHIRNLRSAVWTRWIEGNSPSLRHPGSNPGRPTNSQASCRLNYLPTNSP